MKFVSVAPIDLHSVWAFVRPGCEQVIAKTKDKSLPEDVYAELRAASAVLYLIEDDDKRIGFMVVRRMFDPDGICLFLWQLYADPGTLAREDFLHELDELARNIGAKRIRGLSPRSGFWEGWGKLIVHIYEREVLP